VTIHKETGDKVGINLALRDWIYIVMLLCGMVAYFVRIEMQVRDISGLKDDVRVLKEKVTIIEARHAARTMGPSRGDRDR
jgi:hypothetical protein